LDNEVIGLTMFLLAAASTATIRIMHILINYLVKMLYSVLFISTLQFSGA